MGATYGPFILSLIRAEALTTPEQRLQALDQLARQGFCATFREIVDGKVVEFRDGALAPPEACLHRWLEGAEAEETLSLRRLGGERPYGQFTFLDGFSLLFAPGEATARTTTTLRLPGGEVFRRSVSSAQDAVEALHRRNEWLAEQTSEFWKDYDLPLSAFVEFHETLARNIQRCAQAKVWYGLGGF